MPIARLINCWLCGSKRTTATFTGYRRAVSMRGTPHAHEDIPQYRMKCIACGNAWVDGSGEPQHNERAD